MLLFLLLCIAHRLPRSRAIFEMRHFLLFPVSYTTGAAYRPCTHSSGTNHYARRERKRFRAMSFSVDVCEWSVFRITIKVQALRVSEIGVGNTHWRCRPVGRHESPYTAAVVAGDEIVEPRFGVALFAGEFVVVAAGGRDRGALSAEGIEVRIIEDSSRSAGHYPRGAQVVSEVVGDRVWRRGVDVTPGDAPAPKEDVFVRDVPRPV